MEIKELIELAIKYRDRAYVPYSKFKVGSVVVTDKGNIYGGCNIENAAYSPTNCAERTAIFKAISENESKIDKIVILGQDDFIYPCGVCRQVIKEFASNDCEVIIANPDFEYKIYSFDEMFPFSFGPEDLGVKNV